MSSPASSSSFTHVVRPGESLATLADLYGVPWQAIYHINYERVGGGRWDGGILPGQNVLIPRDAAPMDPAIIPPEMGPVMQSEQIAAVRDIYRETRQLRDVREIAAREKAEAMRKLERELQTPISPYPELERDLARLPQMQADMRQMQADMRQKRHRLVNMTVNLVGILAGIVAIIAACVLQNDVMFSVGVLGAVGNTIFSVSHIVTWAKEGGDDNAQTL